MTDVNKEPFVRWQGRSLEYLSYAINLFLGLSIAAIGFEMSLLKDVDFMLEGRFEGASLQFLWLH